jgi:hypothetical protein
MNIALPLDRTGRDIIRPVSKALFQSIYALEVMLAIARDERFYQAEVAQAAGCQPNYAQQMIRRVEAASLIEPLPAEPGQIRRYYRRLPSPLWDFCEQMVDDLLARSLGRTQVTRLQPRQPESA